MLIALFASLTAAMISRHLLYHVRSRLLPPPYAVISAISPFLFFSPDAAFSCHIFF